MKSGYINPVYKLSLNDVSKVPAKISYSQWSMFEKCPRQWKLSYIDKLAPFTHSIATCFGTAFHETLQEYLTVMYTDSVKAANNIDLRDMLLTCLKMEYQKGVKANNGEHFSTPTELAEHLEDGVQILEWFTKRRAQYFSTKNQELVGIEVELGVPASPSNKNVYWYGFIDIVVRDTVQNKIKILDIKTSRMGWNKYQKADKLKAAQLVAYKKYFSDQFGIPIDNIDIEFFIVKRKLLEESMFPQKRIQLLNPASGSVTRKKIQRSIDTFIEYCFDKDGNKQKEKNYLAIAGKGAKHCKWCPFKMDYENCPKENRIRE
jgi:hypothetical protein